MEFPKTFLHDFKSHSFRDVTFACVYLGIFVFNLNDNEHNLEHASP